jgi:5-methylcytosine-specific restriction endonuclease McrA
LERDDFKCTKCGTHEKLQVHHIRPLREIIKFVFAKHNKVYKNARFNRENESEFQQLLEEVLNEHRLIDGITLCKTCHEEVDYFYRTIKGKKKRED